MTTVHIITRRKNKQAWKNKRKDILPNWRQNSYRSINSISSKYPGSFHRSRNIFLSYMPEAVVYETWSPYSGISDENIPQPHRGRNDKNKWARTICKNPSKTGPCDSYSSEQEILFLIPYRLLDGKRQIPALFVFRYTYLTACFRLVGFAAAPGVVWINIEVSGSI